MQQVTQNNYICEKVSYLEIFEKLSSIVKKCETCILPKLCCLLINKIEHIFYAWQKEASDRSKMTNVSEMP